MCLSDSLCLLMSDCDYDCVTDCSWVLKQLSFRVIADCSIVNKRQSVVSPDDLQVKIADLGNACWTVSYWHNHLNLYCCA